MQGPLAIARVNQAIESRALFRLCFENLFWIAELCERGSEVVTEMRSHNTASRISVGEAGLKSPGAGESADGKIIRDEIKALRSEFPKPRKLSVSNTAKGLMERAYPYYALLSMTRRIRRSTL